jgi:hypothetical protein
MKLARPAVCSRHVEAKARCGGDLVKPVVPRTSPISRDRAVFAHHATDASLPPDSVLIKIDRFGRRFQRVARRAASGTAAGAGAGRRPPRRWDGDLDDRSSPGIRRRSSSVT